jgi:hypothetical protein
MRRLLLPVFITLLGLGIVACGSAGKVTHSVRSVSSGSSTSPGATAATAAAHRALVARIPPTNASIQPHLKNDGDHDEPGDEDHDNSHDTGVDPYIDHLPLPSNAIYHDEDDQRSLSFGRPASAQDTQAVAAIVKRYYSAAAARSGVKACSTMAPVFARAVPLDYGKFGPSYLHGGKTCAAVLSLLFKHLHLQLTEAIQVTDVRVSGSQGFAFFGSKRNPASQIALNRDGRSWRIAQLVGVPLL